MRDAVHSARRLHRHVSCDADTNVSSSSLRESTSFNDAFQRTDRTRFIAVSSLAVERHFTVDWLQRMAAHRAAHTVTGQRSSKRRRTPATGDFDVVVVVSPEPQVAHSSSSSADVFPLLARYLEALRLTFIVVDILLVSYHLTRTCRSAHALCTVGFRERVTLRLADIAFLGCNVHQQLHASRTSAMVVPTDTVGEVPRSVSSGCDDGTRRTTESFSDASVANHRGNPLPPASLTQPVVDLCHCHHSQTTRITANRKSLPFQAKIVSFLCLI